MRTLTRALLACRRGATAVEYGLIVSLVVLAMLASFKTVANGTVSLWRDIGSAWTNAR